MIRVKLYTILGIKEIIGKREFEIDIPENSRLINFIDELVCRWGDAVSNILFEPESKRINSHLRLMINGQDISFLDGINTLLKDGDEVMIFPPVSGG